MEVDRPGDRYRERVIVWEDGEVIKDTAEPLSEHRGHGSARKATTPKGDGSSPNA